jgi:hypothetical protein
LEFEQLEEILGSFLSKKASAAEHF